MIQDFKKYLLDVDAELKKVTWPGGDELRANTVLVIVAATILTMFIGVVDIGLSRVMTGLHALLRF